MFTFFIINKISIEIILLIIRFFEDKNSKKILKINNMIIKFKIKLVYFFKMYYKINNNKKFGLINYKFGLIKSN